MNQIKEEHRKKVFKKLMILHSVIRTMITVSGTKRLKNTRPGIFGVPGLVFYSLQLASAMIH